MDREEAIEVLDLLRTRILTGGYDQAPAGADVAEALLYVLPTDGTADDEPRAHWCSGCKQVTAHPAVACPDCLAELARLRAEAGRLKDVCAFAREACRKNLKEWAYKNEPLLMEAFDRCDAILKSDSHPGGEQNG